MGLDKDLKAALKGLGKMEAIVFSATVTKVNEADKTIEIEDIDGLDYHDVRLAAAEDEKKSVLIIPKVGSSVLVTMIGSDLNTLFVSKVNEVDKIVGVINELDIEDETGFKLHLNNGLMKINGDAFEGIVKAPELKTQIDKNTAIIKAIQQALQSWTPSPNDGGAALKGLVSSIPGMQRANLSNIKNDKIKHG